MLARLIVDSRDAPPNQTATRTVNFDADIRAAGARQVGLTGFDLCVAVPNINSISATAYIETATQSYPVTLVSNLYYTSPDQLRNEIVAKLNGLGLGAWLISIGVPMSTWLITGPVPWRGLANPVYPGANDWAAMIGLRPGGNLENLKTAGPVDLTYSNCYHVISRSLHRRRDADDASTGGRLDSILATVYVGERDQVLGRDDDKVAVDSVYARRTREQGVHNPKWIRVDPEAALAQLDIRILDRRGYDLPAEAVVDYVLEITLRL